MRKFAAIVTALTMAGVGTAVADSKDPKTTSGGVTFTTATGGDGYARFMAKAMPAEQSSGKTVNGSTVVVKENNTPSTLDVSYSGKVECYRQIGNEAIFAGPRDDGSGLYFRIHVRDNGHGGGSPPDQIRVQDTRTTADCDASPDPFRVVESGDLKVHQH